MQDFTIEEFENSMTLYYFKRTGDLHSWGTGINDLSTFGEHKEDYSKILDFLVLPINRYVLDNFRYFSVVEVEEDGKKKKKLRDNSPATDYILK